MNVALRMGRSNDCTTFVSTAQASLSRRYVYQVPPTMECTPIHQSVAIDLVHFGVPANNPVSAMLIRNSAFART